MTRVVTAFVVVCAALMMIGTVPLAVGSSHEVVKGGGGPAANSVSWTFMPLHYGTWNGHIVNNGLRWLVIDVVDNTTGMPQEVAHQRIRFATYGAYPTGVVDTVKIAVAAGHVYEVTATPNGPKGAYCVVEDNLWSPPPPPLVFTYAVDHMTVTVDASGAYDPEGTIVDYSWDFGDGASGTGIILSHVYAMPGAYLITLMVTYNDGSKATTSNSVAIVDSKPAAAFTVVQDGLSVIVDAFGSWDDYGIASYTWDWGDGTAPDVMTNPVANHTYGAPRGTVPLPPPGHMPPYPPYPVFGFTYDSNGNLLVGATVTLTNLRTSEYLTAVSDDTGNYLFEVGYIPWSQGDLLEVTAVSGTMFGSNWAVLDYYVMYIWMDITLRMPGPQLLTLTVKDTIGQTDTTSQMISLGAPAVTASFTYSVVGTTVYVDASGSSASAGISSYKWNWGDGTVPDLLVLPTASHAYAEPRGTIPAPPPSGGGPPVPPYLVWGYVHDSDGSIVSSGHVTVTNVRTGEYLSGDVDPLGFYMVLVDFPMGWSSGDSMEVTIVQETMYGSAWGTLDYSGPYLSLDVTLQPNGPRLVTLTVTDMNGETASVSMLIPLPL